MKFRFTKEHFEKDFTARMSPSHIADIANSILDAERAKCKKVWMEDRPPRQATNWNEWEEIASVQ